MRKVEKRDGKLGVRIEYDPRYDEIDLNTMRNGFQWSGAPMTRELLVMTRDAIDEFLASDQSSEKQP